MSYDAWNGAWGTPSAWGISWVQGVTAIIDITSKFFRGDVIHHIRHGITGNVRGVGNS